MNRRLAVRYGHAWQEFVYEFVRAGLLVLIAQALIIAALILAYVIMFLLYEIRNLAV